MVSVPLRKCGLKKPLAITVEGSRLLKDLRRKGDTFCSSCCTGELGLLTVPKYLLWPKGLTWTPQAACPWEWEANGASSFSHNQGTLKSSKLVMSIIKRRWEFGH